MDDITPPPPPVTAAAQPYASAAPPKRRTGLVVGVALIVLFVLGSCGLTVWAIASAGNGPDLRLGKSIALIYVDQPIAGTGSGSTITPEQIIGELKQAEDDDSVKAIMLRVDSPGGTASASMEIAMEVARLKKPVVASIGDIGASGAYMIASQCDRIVASPSSAVGSIGVIEEFPNVKDLLAKLGVKFTTITQGRYKDAGSPYRSLTATETSMLQAQTKLVYEQFIDYVAKGRKLPVSEVETLATGWVWTGDEAKKLGLVDEIGNYTDGVRATAKLGGIKGYPDIVTYRSESLSGLLGQLTGLLSSGKPAEALRRQLGSTPVIR
jgi:protease IV